MKSTSTVEEQHAEIKENFTKLSESIGRFIISFENLLAIMKHGIALLYSRHGMNNQDVVDVMVAEMTADPLLKKFDGLIAVTFIEEMKDPETKKRLNDIYIEIDEAIKFRNKLAHAHWHISQSIDVNTDELSKPYLVSKSQKLKRTVGLVDNFPNADFNITEQLNSRSELNYKLSDRLYEIVINIRERAPLKKKWFQSL